MPDSLTTFATSSLFNPDWSKSQRQSVDTESIAPTNSVEVQGSTQDSTTDAPPSTETGKLAFLAAHDLKPIFFDLLPTEGRPRYSDFDYLSFLPRT
jgi:hypothetical protein